MASVAEPFTTLMREAAAGFAEAREIADREGTSAKPGSDTLSYIFGSALSGVERLRILARRYSASEEARAVARGEGGATPILANKAFQTAAEETSGAVEACGALVGIAGRRIAATIRAWIATGSPDHALVLGSQAETAARILKRKAAR